MSEILTERDRFFRAMRYENCDRRPLHLVGPWHDTLERWYKEGLPKGKDPNEFLGLKSLQMTNITPIAGLHPVYEKKILKEEGNEVTSIDSYGRTILDFKDHTTMPEWLDFPVKTPEDLRKLMDEHFDVKNLDARFAPDWEKKIKTAMKKNNLILIDGGCYYWTIRSIAGVDGASYLFYDAPELVDELFERYFTVVMEGLKRAVKIAKIDVIGFGEDVAFKTGPLISPEMFRKFILPRYKKTMDFAHKHGVEFTWYDSDGDVRAFIPDYLSIGINCLAPCEVAANMIPCELRKNFGRPLRMVGGIDKREIAKGKKAIDAEIARNKPVIQEGGFLPAIDHSVSADISWDNYRYFIDAIQKAIVL